jgi:F-type H+-transporting ATPase subunit gamma
MATLRQLKRRITSVRNTAKITNALQLVAASKMRRAQDRALQARPYAQQLQRVLAGLASAATADPDETHPLLTRRPIEHVGILHITPDRGLCGALNGNLNRAAGTWAASQDNPVQIVAVGKKGRDFFFRARQNITAEFTDLGDYPRAGDTLSISRVVTHDFIGGAVDEVYMSYPRFVTTASQVPTIVRLLPIEPPTLDDTGDGGRLVSDYIFEPSPAVVFERLLPRYVDMLIYQAVLENAASFQAAQMVAMKNATDNAGEIEQELTLTYNKARQEQITNELLDIVGGAAALEG